MSLILRLLPIIAANISTIIGSIAGVFSVVVSIRDLLTGDGDIVQRLQTLQFAADAILAETTGSKALAEATLLDVHFARTDQWPIVLADAANTLAHVTEHLPGATAAGMWDEPVGILSQANSPMTARVAMQYAGSMSEYWHLFGRTPHGNNPDFALAFPVATRWLPLGGDFNPRVLSPRTRPAGQTVLQYLQNVQSAKGWFQDGPLAMRYIYNPGTATIAAHLLCTLQEDGTSATDGQIAEILANTETVIDNTVSLIGDVGEVITATVQSAAADAAILAADFSPEADPRIDVLVDRTIQTAAADAAILAPPAAREVGLPIALGESGELDVTGAIGLLITLADIPDAAAQPDTLPPARYRRLGNYALAGHGGGTVPRPLEWVTTFVPIDSPDITVLYWHVYLPTTATVRLITLEQEI